MPRKSIPLAFIFLTFLLSLTQNSCARKWDVLSDEEKNTLGRILLHWETWVPARQKDGTAPMMTYEELYQGLGVEEKKFLDRVRTIRPDKSSQPENIQFHRVDGQSFTKNGKREDIGSQYLPDWVFKAYSKMMEAMQKDLGKKLLVESGYRSRAYQLYTFLFYLPKHGYSLTETRRWVALPGHSEHGNPTTQAIDFMNQEGVNGDDKAEDFERLPEYDWLMQHAGEYGFTLSYPRGTKDTTFEPWHWRYDLRSADTSRT